VHGRKPRGRVEGRQIKKAVRAAGAASTKQKTAEGAVLGAVSRWTLLALGFELRV